MDDANPFTKLGLQKDVVESLHRQGRLDEFLRTYYRSIQPYIHPDRGGDSALAAKINAAYDSLRRNPECLEAWVRSMSNGNDSNPEYLALIEGLSAKVEELQGMETEYRKLQEQYARLLVSRTGDGTKAKVRTASPRAERDGDEFYSASDDGSDFTEEAPAVRRPRARRVDTADVDPAPRAATGTKTKRAAPKAEPIVLENLISYNLDGKPAATYTAYLDGEAVRGADGEYLIKSQREFEKYFASGKDGRLPTAMEWYAMIERLHDTKNPALEGIVRDMKESWLCTGTGIDYAANTIVHPGHGTIACPIPAGDHWLDEIIGDKKWKKVFQALFGPKDVERLPEVFQAVSGKRTYIWTPSAESRKSYPERAVWVIIDSDRFDLICNLIPIIILGRSRRVRVESAAGAREK